MQPSMARHGTHSHEGLRSSCLVILWALGPSVEIVGCGASGSEALCVGFRPLPHSSQVGGVGSAEDQIGS